MAKHTHKRVSRHVYDEDEFNDEELIEELEDEEEEYEDDYNSDEDEYEDEDEYDSDYDDESPRRRSRKKNHSSKKRVEASPNKEVRLKAFWSIYSQSNQRVETFEYGEKEKAEARAAKLTESNHMLYFVKLDKKVIES